jgi:hypothetical protein
METPGCFLTWRIADDNGWLTISNGGGARVTVDGGSGTVACDWFHGSGS